MRQFVRRFLPTSILSGAIALTLLFGFSFGAAKPAEARGGHLSLSIGVGVPFGYYGGFYGPGYYPGYYRSGWYGAPYYPYYEPTYYAPRPVYYSRPYAGPIVSLGLFPAYVGEAMNTDDRTVYFGAYQRALTAPVGQTMAWNSGSISGEVTTTRDGWAGPRYCRQFSQSITVSGQVQQSIGTACQTADGAWQLVQNQ